MVIKIGVFIKQVPANSDGKMDPKKGLLIRKGEPKKFNVFDYSALELAFHIKTILSDVEISCFTMGPDESEAILYEGLALGADKAYHICDRAFSGADALVTSYTLSQCVDHVADFDLLLCGKQTTDGDTGQVGSGIAAFKEIPYIGTVSFLDAVTDKTITVSQKLTDGYQTIKVPFPALLSTEKELYPIRIPSLKGKIQAKKQVIQRITLLDLPNQNVADYGAKGSPTRVRKIYSAAIPQEIRVNTEPIQQQTAQIKQIMQDLGVLG
ncbi:electron transfer flavoprotein subunit beta/FixA family protein [Carnobacterium gallinarum]|uniref:electron transfer flavoprotein subunit beta/FixA family protein n=1 Tax=Carnobacterium gallinarum TaxID=2749 RepID=UPI0006924FB3|nr:electron transfer flavoprotein subunit beta/FixA family protein [Carnobacterium gallinarum]